MGRTWETEAQPNAQASDRAATGHDDRTMKLCYCPGKKTGVGLMSWRCRRADPMKVAGRGGLSGRRPGSTGELVMVCDGR